MSVASCLLLFIAIKRQWCRECILKFEGFAKTKGFLLRSDLLRLIAVKVRKYVATETLRHIKTDPTTKENS